MSGNNHNMSHPNHGLLTQDEDVCNIKIKDKVHTELFHAPNYFNIIVILQK